VDFGKTLFPGVFTAEGKLQKEERAFHGVRGGPTYSGKNNFFERGTRGRDIPFAGVLCGRDEGIDAKGEKFAGTKRSAPGAGTE